MPSFWEKSMPKLIILTRRHCQCLSFDLKTLPMPSCLPEMVNFHYRNDNASRLRRSHRNNSQTHHSRPIWIPHSSLVATPLVTRGESKWAFVTRLGIIFSFHLWQATRERKKPVPSPQPKGIKTMRLTGGAFWLAHGMAVIRSSRKTYMVKAFRKQIITFL